MIERCGRLRLCREELNKQTMNSRKKITQHPEIIDLS